MIITLRDLGSERSFKSPNMDYKFNSTKHPSHINMGHNCAMCSIETKPLLLITNWLHYLIVTNFQGVFHPFVALFSIYMLIRGSFKRKYTIFLLEKPTLIRGYQFKDKEEMEKATVMGG